MSQMWQQTTKETQVCKQQILKDKTPIKDRRRIKTTNWLELEQTHTTAVKASAKTTLTYL